MTGGFTDAESQMESGFCVQGKQDVHPLPTCDTVEIVNFVFLHIMVTFYLYYNVKLRFSEQKLYLHNVMLLLSRQRYLHCAWMHV